eukprot:2506709-Heterocapsa_arctica.AAC.1
MPVLLLHELEPARHELDAGQVADVELVPRERHVDDAPNEVVLHDAAVREGELAQLHEHLAARDKAAAALRQAEGDDPDNGPRTHERPV